MNPLLLVHRLLRGRYWWAIGLSVVLGGPLAWLGYRSKTPMYTSEAIVRIAPTQSPILFQTEQNEAIPYFDQYVSSQAALMGNEQTLRSALAAEGVEEAGWEGGNRGLVALRRAVSVQAPARAGMLRLTVSHRDPAAAQAACAAILAVYRNSYDQDTRTVFIQQKQALAERIRLRAIERDGALETVQEIARLQGTEHLQPQIDSLSRELVVLEIRLAQLKAELAVRGVDVDIDPAQGERMGRRRLAECRREPTGSPIRGRPHPTGPPRRSRWRCSPRSTRSSPSCCESGGLVTEIEAFTEPVLEPAPRGRTREAEAERTDGPDRAARGVPSSTWGQGPDLASATNERASAAIRAGSASTVRMFSGTRFAWHSDQRRGQVGATRRAVQRRSGWRPRGDWTNFSRSRAARVLVASPFSNRQRRLWPRPATSV
ncbi:MAG: hypothetical protein R3B68_08625 [Phycisphaerales bacterium]